MKVETVFQFSPIISNWFFCTLCQFFAFHFADQKPVQLDENVDDEEAEPKVVKDDAKIQVHNILGKVKVH